MTKKILMQERTRKDYSLQGKKQVQKGLIIQEPMRVKETHTNEFNGCEYLPVKISQHVSKNLEQNSPIVLLRSQSRILVHRFEEQNKLKRRRRRKNDWFILRHFRSQQTPSVPKTTQWWNSFTIKGKKVWSQTGKMGFSVENEAFFRHRTNCEDH